MKKGLNTGAKILVSVSLIAYLAHNLDWIDLAQVFSRTRPLLFLAAVIFFSLSNFLGASQWFLLLRAQNLVISLRQAIVFYLVGVFFNNVLLGNIGGDALRIYDIRRLTGESSSGIAATLMDRFIGLFSTCTLALMAVPFLEGVPHTGLLSVLLPTWVCLIAILTMGLSRRMGHALEGLVDRWLPTIIAELLRRLRLSIVVYRQHVALLLVVWCISVCVQFNRILVYWVAGQAIGMRPGLIYFICFQPVAAIIAAVPISVGGLGIRENTLVNLFGHTNIAGEVSTAMSLLGYLAGIVASLIGGVTFVIRRVDRRKTK